MSTVNGWRLLVQASDVLSSEAEAIALHVEGVETLSVEELVAHERRVNAAIGLLNASVRAMNEALAPSLRAPDDASALLDEP